MNCLHPIKLDDIHQAVFDVAGAARYAGVSTSTIYRMIKQGQLSFSEHPSLRTSKQMPKIFIHKTTIDAVWGKNWRASVKNPQEIPPHARIRI